MIYIECPTDYEMPVSGAVSVFLAGGTTGCPDFQAYIRNQLENFPDTLIIFNPRRANISTNPSIAADQIKWEHDYLSKASLISFWFPKETLYPIGLYELCAWSVTPDTQKPLIVGTHPDYSRRQDVVIQTSIVCPGLPIFDNLDDVVASIKHWYEQLL